MSETPPNPDNDVTTVEPLPAPEPAPVEGDKPSDAPAVQEPKTDGPEVVIAAEDLRLRKGFSALAKKEKAIRQKEQALKALEERVAKVDALRQKAKENPLEVLQEYGLTYEQLTDFILSGNAPKEATPDDRVKALEERLERDAKEREETAKAAKVDDEKRRIMFWKETVLVPGLKANADRWECIHARGDAAYELVIDVMAAYTNKHGVPPAADVAADQVEKDLEEEGRIYAGLKKFRPQSEPETTGSTLSRNKAGELPVVTNGVLPLDPDERNKAILRGIRLWQ